MSLPASIVLPSPTSSARRARPQKVRSTRCTVTDLVIEPPNVRRPGQAEELVELVGELEAPAFQRQREVLESAAHAGQDRALEVLPGRISRGYGGFQFRGSTFGCWSLLR
jgi:hypothetical protein